MEYYLKGYALCRRPLCGRAGVASVDVLGQVPLTGDLSVQIRFFYRFRVEFGTIWGRILESFWRNLDLEGPSVPAWRVFIDFWSILGSNLDAFRQPWGLCLAT